MWKILVIFGLIIVISMIDIGINVVSLIPIIGDALETAGEAVLETLQLTLTGLIVALVGMDKQ